MDWLIKLLSIVTKKLMNIQQSYKWKVTFFHCLCLHYKAMLQAATIFGCHGEWNVLNRPPIWRQVQYKDLEKVRVTAHIKNLFHFQFSDLFEHSTWLCIILCKEDCFFMSHQFFYQEYFFKEQVHISFIIVKINTTLHWFKGWTFGTRLLPIIMGSRASAWATCLTIIYMYLFH